MYGLAQVPVTERTMLEKDEALKPANMVTGRLGGRYVGRNRKWQGIPSLTRTRGGSQFLENPFTNTFFVSFKPVIHP